MLIQEKQKKENDTNLEEFVDIDSSRAIEIH
jgi:hypothetical protein